LVNDDYVRLLLELVKNSRVIHAVLAGLPHEIGVAENLEGQKAIQNVRQQPFYVPFPDRHAPGFRHEQHHALFFENYQMLNKHQADESFAETDAITQERTAVIRGDLQQRLVAVTLILVEDGMDG